MKIKQILKQSWRITQNHPLLWFFGFFAFPLISNEINLIIINVEKINNWTKNFFVFKDFSLIKILNAFGFEYSSNLFFNFNLILTIIIGIFFLWLIFLAQIALFYRAFTNENLSFKEYIKKSKKFFPNIIAINLSALIISSILLIVTSFLLIKTHFYLNHSFCLSSTIIIIGFIVIEILISYITRYALCFTIYKKERFLSSIKKSIIFFFKNMFPSFKVTIYLFLISILIGIGFSLISIGTYVPFIFFHKLALQLNCNIILQPIIIFWIILLSSIFLLLISMYSAWQFLTWGIVFQELNNREK